MSQAKPNIYLTGFSYTGKSTVARLLAEQLGMDYRDTDSLIQERHGRTIPDIFETDGESVFREMESEALREIAEGQKIVVATGGGMVLDPENRELMQRTGLIICLEAQPVTILARMQADAAGGDTRPLLASANPLARIEQVKARRQAAYAISDWIIQTDHLAAKDVASEALRGLEHAERRFATARLLENAADDNDAAIAYTVRTESASYPIIAAPGALNELGRHMSQLGIQGRACLITDSGIPNQPREAALTSLADAGFAPVTLEFPMGESSKTLAQAGNLYDRLSALRIERRDVIVALGGGVVGDLAGYVAATYMRGIAFVQVPTTLLGMVDASIGGKVAIDLPTGKNLVGAFYQPRLVLADTKVLDTLSPRHLTAGWAEVIKTAAIFDADLFEFLEMNADAILAGHEQMRASAIARCCAIKGRVVSLDEREQTGLRARLNLGHTLGHALETALDYSGILHGEAVAIGMAFAAHLAERMGALTADERQRQIALLSAYGLPTSAPTGVDWKSIRDALAVDKKVSAGQTRWILCDGIGRGRLRGDVPVDVSDGALTAFLAGQLA